MTDQIEKRQTVFKEKIIEGLKESPIVQIVCKRVGIGRATYYRWKKENKEFSDKTDEAMQEGIKLMNDMAESKLLSLIKEGNLTGIIFWLKNRHDAYKTRIEVSTANKKEVVLSDEQEEIIKKAIGLLEANKKEGKNDK